MQILLASAKIMRVGHMPAELPLSVPRFQRVAQSIAEELSIKSGECLSELFSCSPEIGEQNKSRFEIFGTDEAEIIPALFAYFGQAYKYLKADQFTLDDILWANEHLWISTCMYGLLRPLDGINHYRMESGFPLRATSGLKVEDFWKPLLTDLLIESVKADDGILVYLDTMEFRRLFDWKKVEKEIPVIIEPTFHNCIDGIFSMPSVWTKTGRGAMARYIIQNRITDIEGLRAFEYEGYKYNPTMSPFSFVRNL